MLLPPASSRFKIPFSIKSCISLNAVSEERFRVKQRNFNDYKMVRMNQSPGIEVHIVNSIAKMGGAGEPGVPPIAPALANAIFVATGQRCYKLPLRAKGFSF
ncbi:MAG TPA: hypothetical protein VK508_15955 [Cyclobacteriaceae bacterium]|nr:hypothetical protein [Cyclobacteriaceae bacterium]